MKFLVDSTAGKLARWLRILGHDVLYVQSGSAGAMLGTARRESRILLSRNRDLAKRDSSVAVALYEDSLEGQLRQVNLRYAILEKSSPFTRCLLCNSRLSPAGREEARNRVPLYVYQTQKEFGYCPSCDKFYWKATHWAAMKERLSAVLG